MGIKSVLSKKVVAIGLAGTIGLGAVGGATYAAAPGLVDRIITTWFNTFDSNLTAYKKDIEKAVPSRVSSAISNAAGSFNSYYNTKLELSKKKIDDDTNAYIKDKSTLSADEKKQVTDKLDEKVDKKVNELTAELKAQVDAEFAK